MPFYPQSVLFDRTLWKPSEAVKWLDKHGYCHYKIDIKEKHLRFRQFDPTPGAKYITKVLPNGVSLVLEKKY